MISGENHGGSPWLQKEELERGRPRPRVLLDYAAELAPEIFIPKTATGLGAH